MAILSEHPASVSWPFPSITNNYDDPCRAVKRKRSCDHHLGKAEFNEEQGPPRSSSKRARIGPVSDASNTPHSLHDEEYDRHGCANSPAVATNSVDVANFLALLLDGLNKRSKVESLPNVLKPLSPYQRRPTSPLSQSPYRQSFVRKRVGGHFSRRVEPSLQRWVLYNNHIQDVRSCSPCYRSEEWIETLHEMGWEGLHPYYPFDGTDVFTPSIDDSEESSDDLFEVDVRQFATVSNA